MCSRHDVNEGNVLKIIKLISIENEHFKTNFNLLPKNSKYVSPEIQNDIIKAISKLVLQLIVNEVHIGSQIFSLVENKARDQSKTEQMRI